MRVVQKNLVYVIGLGSKYASEEVLKQPNLFGQYGKINKIVFSKKPTGTGPNATIGAYITYAKAEDAAKAISAVNGMKYDGRVIKAMVGSTKYCLHYLQNQPCTSPGCMYLHEPADDGEPMEKEEPSSKISKQSVPSPPNERVVPKKLSSQTIKSSSTDKLKHGGSALPSGASWAKTINANHPHNESNTSPDHGSSYRHNQGDFSTAMDESNASPILVAKSYNSTASSPEERVSNRSPPNPEPGSVSNSTKSSANGKVNPGQSMDFAAFLNLASKNISPEAPTPQILPENESENSQKKDIPKAQNNSQQLSDSMHGYTSSLTTSQILAALSQSLNLNDSSRYNSSSLLQNILKQPLKTYQGPFNPFDSELDNPIGGLGSNLPNGYFQPGYSNQEFSYSSNSPIGLGGPAHPHTQSPNNGGNSMFNPRNGGLNQSSFENGSRSFSHNIGSKLPGFPSGPQPGLQSRGFNPFEHGEDKGKIGGLNKTGSAPPPGLLNSRSGSFESNITGRGFDPFNGPRDISGDGYGLKQPSSNNNPMMMSGQSAYGQFSTPPGMQNYFKPSGMHFEEESSSFGPGGRSYSNFSNMPQAQSALPNGINVGRPARPY
ncbi:hypothetical protein CONCODRAFT_141476 [Conidiobolus coronatus NRRL 28638]|uniref:RRM domain-containing protein n=1 Tax=Conidiobolus coronatus (strain ATCC 28846 / CBS 209.66 / NRRL 28638) TaxID=796925 RepID=A0A137NS35_CONC2|nr:hypothetical protein CONCODRAFT_141476 [Conidiobolus coronatus NRRL 28638]|eukprot:KXN65502.1 hypothetical protein CONCODRAFT_141476 [Conidiobolus coronatus NRRL 28638]